ncbi:ATP-binding protein [Streptomyces sp. NPDC048514]|uniref:ATP-binding protein n=1 Tax=Streptomyces sp. NPDC048514 TaxID=3365564 RepID=UPI00371C62E0
MDATAPGHARQEVRRILRSWDLGPSETADAAELVVSELVTNAVVHGTAPVILQCRADRDHFSVTVCDTGSAVEQPCPKTVEPSSEGGRGMLLVDSLTRDLHVETGLLGTTVTATL